MPAIFTDLDSIEKLDELFERSHSAPVLIFKHSNTCGISSMISGRVKGLDADVNLIVVQKNRDVSNELAQRTGIRHESPQAFVLRDGEAVYNASHYSIDPDQITKELGK